MSLQTIKFDYTKFDAGLAAMASQSKRSRAQVLREVARNFVRRAAEVTPPKKRAAGLRTLRADLGKIMVAGTPKRGTTAEQPKAVHLRNRGNNGRVSGRQRPNRARIPGQVLRDYRRQVESHVGWLRSGWAVAAQALGARMPSWVRLPAPGSIRIDVSGDRMVVTVTNKVEWAGAVRGLVSRIQFALNAQGDAMMRRAEAGLKAAARQAGFKVS